jgi:pyruvate kinase
LLLARRARIGRKDKLGVIAKIETASAVRHLPEIIVPGAARGPFAVMIARGHLAVEIGFLRIAEMQEEILWICEAAHVPVIWATQMLENLAKRGVPSRAEITDAAMSVRSECVMLNKGPYVTEAVQTLDALLQQMSAHQRKKQSTLRASKSWDRLWA